MNDFEFTGRIIKEAREAKGWTQLQLADALDVDIRTVRRLEDGTSKHGTEIFLKCVVTLRLSADICVYAPRDEAGLLMHRIYQEMLQLTPEQKNRHTIYGNGMTSIRRLRHGRTIFGTWGNPMKDRKCDKSVCKYNCCLS